MKSLKRYFQFGYTIQRDYDLWWFTPITVVGGLAGIVFFSLINLASNGYELSLQYTSDPSTVLDAKPWYMSWSWDKQLQPNYSDQNIPVGAQVFTTNLGFTYTLKSVWWAEPPGSNNVTEYGSLPYLAQFLEDCTVEGVSLILTKADQSLPGPTNSRWVSWDDSSAQATAHCTARTRNGDRKVQLQMTYKPTASRFDYVIQSNYTDSASMWWATRLMNLYWYSTLTALSQQLFGTIGMTNFTTQPAWTRGIVTYSPDGNVKDITRPEFFNVDYFFLAANGRYVNQDTEQVNKSSLLFNNASSYAYSESLTEGLSFARVLYSALLVDFGSNSSQNVLLDEKLLQWTLLHPDDTFRNQPGNLLNATRKCSPGEIPGDCYDHYPLISVIPAPNISLPTNGDLTHRKTSQFMNSSYDAYKSQVGRLVTKNDTAIFSQYACQVPRGKPFGTIILPLLVADLVFLQACWKILNLVAVKWTEHKDVDRTAMWCVGCIEKHDNLGSHSAGDLEHAPGDMELSTVQGKKTRASISRASHGTTGSYLSLGSNGSEETARH